MNTHEKLPPITRKFLVAVVTAAPAFPTWPLIDFCDKLTARGLYTEATADEIEESDNLI